MNLREIELLHALMSHGSVSDAARLLHMSQPNASKILKKLENSFGFALFERINSRLHPTEEARLLFDQVERTLISMRRFHTLTEDIRDMHTGSLTIGGLPLLSRKWLPDVLARFMHNHPGISTTFHTRSSKKLIEWVAERQIDIAVGLLPVEDSMVEKSILIEVEFVAAIPANHHLAKRKRIKANDIDGQDFISLSLLDNTREEIDQCLRNANATPIERIECSLPSVALEFVERGIGISLVDHISAMQHRAENIVYRPLVQPIRKSVWLMRPRMRPQSRLVDEFTEMLHRTVEVQSLSTPPSLLFG